MSPRSSVAPVVASGTVSAVKLLIATLAFAGAYLGVEATYGIPAQPAGAAAQARTVELSSRSMPATAQVPAPGTVTVSAVDALGPCDRPYQARSLVENNDPRATVSYGWRLERWSPGTRRWQTYLGIGSGFSGESQTVEWQPRVVNNPGWYRVVLSVSGDAPLRSERFLVSC
ncbi:hypothetical protein [Streptosporangium sp. NBC_01469]|uniref:hypothetical protein n=1 Tax=Streptosporangium sp. NBC_01469 TaxID=2903898 RepID=UPI002E2BB1A5|nr:hypothetical protein [Streptosporangium sp. NBC_01469]